MKNNDHCTCHHLLGLSKSLCLVALLVFANAFPIAANAALLSGSVSFDSNTGLYTYSYTLDNTSGPAAIKEFSVLVDSSQASVSAPPVSHSDPTAWSFGAAVSGTSALSPLDEYGAFWQWYGSQALTAGGIMSGFSFTTPHAPVTDSANNYFLWSNSYSGGPSGIGNGGIVEWGHIVAPNFSAPTAVPIPAAACLFGSGLLGLIGVARRQKASNDVKTF